MGLFSHNNDNSVVYFYECSRCHREIPAILEDEGRLSYHLYQEGGEQAPDEIIRENFETAEAVKKRAEKEAEKWAKEAVEKAKEIGVRVDINELTKTKLREILDKSGKIEGSDLNRCPNSGKSCKESKFIRKEKKRVIIIEGNKWLDYQLQERLGK